MTVIYKIAPVVDWESAVVRGVYEGSDHDRRDGFIHFSSRDQLLETAEKHFGGMTGLCLVAVASEELGEDLKWEPSRNGDLFPHLYGPLPLSCVLWVCEFPLRADGHFQIPDWGD